MAADRKKQTPSSSGKGGRGASAKAAAGEPKQTRRARLFRRMMQVGLLRRRTARRLIKTLEKSKKKGRVLPDQLVELDEYLAKVPVKERQAVLEASLSGELEANASRAMRRAAERQDRQSGRAGGGQRPGMPPLPRAARRVK